MLNKQSKSPRQPGAARSKEIIQASRKKSVGVARAILANFMWADFIINAFVKKKWHSQSLANFSESILLELHVKFWK